MNIAKLVGCVFAFVTLTTFASAQTPEASEASKDKLFWIFLTTGKTTTGVPVEEIRKMQGLHLANFSKLAQAGKLLCAGPLNDPNQKLRGIVVVKAADLASVEQMFGADPYVTNGFMKVDADELVVQKGKFAAKVTPSAMEELSFVVLNRKEGVKPTADSLAEQAEYVTKLAEDGAVMMAGEFPTGKSRQFVWICKPRTDLKQLVEASPAVAKVGLGFQIMPIYLGKDSITTD